jgi:dipeptidyl aminopeptidase/acylaminoacyl peptidase
MTEQVEKQSVKPEDLFKLKILQDARLSPDGKSVVYCISYVDNEKDEENASLWLLSLEDGQSRQLTAGNGRDHSPVWSPDSKEIAFLSTRSGAPQVYVIPVDGGEARAVTSMQQPIGGGPSWSPDGRYLAFTAGPKMEAPPDPGKPYRVDRHVYRFDGIGYLHLAVQDIYIIPEAGGEVKQLTSDAFMNTNPLWSPDGQEILFSASFDPHSHAPRPVLKMVDLQAQVRTIVGSDWGIVEGAAWLPTGKGIVFSGVPREAPIGTKSDLWVVKRHGSQPECRTAGLKVGVGGGLQPDFPAMPPGRIGVSRDSSNAFINVQDGGSVHIYEIALSGKEAWKPILQGERSLFLNGINAEKILFCTVDLQNLPDVYIANLDGTQEQQLTHLNEEIVSGWMAPEVEHISFEGAEGAQIEGWIMKPTVGEAPYPTVLYIHGGPHGAFGNTFSFDFRMLTGAGYAVLFINPQGSTGYGSEFASVITKDWGNRDYRDLMAGVDYVIEKGITDADRLGVAGISYGGYMTTWIVGHTDRFKAAIPENPVTDLVSLYGTSDISAWLGEQAFGGKPFETPEIYRKCSPITYAHNCRTPTLLIQGERDFRCPAGQSEQFYTTLKVNGCIVEMMRFPSGSHIMSIGGDLVSRRTENQEILKWFNRYILGNTPEGEEEKKS